MSNRSANMSRSPDITNSKNHSKTLFDYVRRVNKTLVQLLTTFKKNTNIDTKN